MRICVYPGSFDVFTVAHADIVKRAAKLFDYCHVGVLVNEHKKPYFTATERVQMINTVIADMGIKNADAMQFSGLLVDFARKCGACATVRGIRDISDYENESKMCLLNAALYRELETVFLLSKPELSMISSSAVKEISKFGGDISEFVPSCILSEVLKRGAN